MHYFFILGSNPTLSFAELASVLQLKPTDVLLLTKEAAVVEQERPLEARELMRRLGGTIKFGIIRTTVDAAECTPELAAELLSDRASQSKGKFSFGFSFYGQTAVSKKTFGMEAKRLLKEQGVSPRWVISKEKQLSSVVVEQNKLTTDRGMELVFIPSATGEELFVGETLAVQPFKELSKRDYGRPGRDDYSGMLPPKLALMMINLTPQPPLLQTGEGEKPQSFTLLDPFCGSGTVITEAMLRGVSKVIGTDSSNKAVEDTKRNVTWIKEHFSQAAGATAQVVHCDARQLSRSVKKQSVDVIVTEPYLGPSRMLRDRDAMEQVKRDLEQLYAAALAEFEAVLKSGGTVVMIWPVFKVGNNKKLWLNESYLLKNSSFAKVNILSDFPESEVVGGVTERDSILYARQGQQVEREIVVLQKK